MHPLAAAFGLVGSIFLLRARHTLPLFMALFTFACIVGSSSTFAAIFGPGPGDWLNKHIITTRLVMLVKPFWYCAGAFFLVASWKALNRFLSVPGNSAGSSRQRSVALHPVAFATRRSRGSSRVCCLGKREMVERRPIFRIAHGFDQDEHSLTDLGIEVPRPFYKIWVTPTGHFKYNLGSAANEALQAVMCVLLCRNILFPRGPIFGLSKSLRANSGSTNFGIVPFEIEGKGPVELTHFGDEEIELRAGPGAHGRLRLNVSYFPKWRTTLDTVPIPITAAPAPEVEHSAFMQIELLPGTYHFHYRNNASDYLGTFLCLLGAAGCGPANWEQIFRAGFPLARPTGSA